MSVRDLDWVKDQGEHGVAFIELLFISAVTMAAGEKAPSPTPAAASESEAAFDTRLESLQSTKDCIHNAKTRSEIEQCRRSISIKRERVHVQ